MNIREEQEKYEDVYKRQDYIITASSVLSDGTLIHSKEDLQRDDIRPYIKDGVLNLYMSWFMM